MKSLKTILFVVALSGALFPIQLCAQKTTTVDEITAVVGAKIILKSDIENQYGRYLAEGNPPDTGLKCNIFEQLFLSKLLADQAALDSINISDDQVEGELNRKLAYFISQIGSEEKLEQYFKKPFLEIKAELRDVLREQMLAQQVQQGITSNINVTPYEVKKFFDKIPLDSLPSVGSELEIAQIIKKARISKADKLEVRNKLQGIKERIEKGESFSTMAVLYSEDPGTSKKGGELGFLARGRLVPEFEAVAYTLKGDQISDIIETQFGFHLIQLIERRGNTINARHILIKPKVSPEALAMAKASIDSAVTDIKSGKLTFAQAALKYSDSDDPGAKNGGVMVNPYTGSTRFELSQISQVDPSMSFQIDRLEVGKMSDPSLFNQEDGTTGYRIFQLNNRQEAHKANLKDDYLIIQKTALQDKQNKTLNKWTEKKIKETYIQINVDSYKSCPSLKTWSKSIN